MKTYKIIFTNRELNDLFDMLYIVQSGDVMKNNLDKSWKSIMNKIEPIVCPEIEWEVLDPIKHKGAPYDIYKKGNYSDFEINTKSGIIRRRKK